MNDFGKRNTQRGLLIGFLLGSSLFGFGCSSVPEDGSSNSSRSSGGAPNEFSVRIEESLRKRIAFLEDQEIEAYLGKVAGRLFSPSRDPIKVELVSGSGANYEASAWAIPNGHIFFDVRLLRTLKFENEIAAALTFARERAEGPEFRERLIQEAGRADPNPAALWKFSEVEDQRAIEVAVDRLYKSGYDPRGLTNFFDRAPAKKNAAPDLRQESNKEKARRTISFYAPLLNPIVRTEDFYRMRKKLERL